MKWTASAAAFTVVGLCSIAADAQSLGAYKCTVKNAYALKAGGQIPHQVVVLAGKEFVVDRTNGRMVGAFSSAGWQTARVLDKGSNQQSFKAVYVSAPFVHVRFLIIREYDAGDIKDFSLTDDDEVTTGICAYLN